MAKILLNVEVELIQKEIRKLSALLRRINEYKLTLQKEGADVEANIKTFLQENIDLLGSYSVDDVDGNLDIKKSTLANLSIAVSNITAMIKRLNALESAGINIPHYTSEANRDRAIPKPTEGQTCYVGANTAWTLNTYENGAWVKGFLSQHSTSALPADYEEKEITITPDVYENIEHFSYSNAATTSANPTLTIPNDEEIIAIITTAKRLINTDQYGAEIVQTSKTTWNISINGNNPDFNGTITYNDNKFVRTNNKAANLIYVGIQVRTRKIKTPAVKATVLVKK